MLSFMGQGQLGKLHKLATFAYQKRISENPQLTAVVENYEKQSFTFLAVLSLWNAKHKGLTWSFR